LLEKALYEGMSTLPQNTDETQFFTQKKKESGYRLLTLETGKKKKRKPYKGGPNSATW